METAQKTLGKIERSILALVAAGLLAIPFVFAVGEPDNVSGLTATAVNQTSIALSWNSARDVDDGLVDHYRVYHGTTSVQTAGTGDYDKEADTPNNNTSYVVQALTPGTTYYFSVTAIDKKDAESEAYSLEANAATLGAAAEGEETPAAGDTTAPTVKGVTAPFKTQVIVEFSEEVVLPAEMPQAAFTINEQVATTTLLDVSAATLDATKTKVNLTTAAQKAGVSYALTAGVAITDKAGNPIVSGNTDTGLFVGSALDVPAAEGSTPAPTETPAVEPVVEVPVVVEPTNCGNDETCFYNNLKTCVPATVTQVENQTQTKRMVTGVENTDCVLKYEVATVTDLTNPKTLECRIPKTGLEERVKGVQDKTAKLFKDEAETKQLCIGSYLTEFVQSLFASVPAPDTTPPENISNLVLTFKEEMEKFIVMLRWVASLNSAGDLVDQILYMSLDRGKTYGQGNSLGSTKTSHEVGSLEGGKEYTFKVTTKDATGNESVGVIKSIRLPQTGAAVGLLLAGSVWGARRLLRRRRK